MILNSRIFGQSEKKLIILHGFLGSLDNWVTIAKKFSDIGFEVHVLDQRNHGKSFHSDEFTYKLMSEDLKKYIEYKNLDKVSIMGHSMGGKTACCFALHHKTLVEKLIIVDILPIKYDNNYDLIFKALNSVNLNSVQKRSDFDNHLKNYFKDELFISFLSKNLIRSNNGIFKFKFNLASLISNINNILSEIESNYFYEKNIFFIRGTKSDYVTDEGLKKSSLLFTNYELISVEDGGHWLHYEKQLEFFDICKKLLSA